MQGQGLQLHTTTLFIGGEAGEVACYPERQVFTWFPPSSATYEYWRFSAGGAAAVQQRAFGVLWCCGEWAACWLEFHGLFADGNPGFVIGLSLSINSSFFNAISHLVTPRFDYLRLVTQ